MLGPFATRGDKVKDLKCSHDAIVILKNGFDIAIVTVIT